MTLEIDQALDFCYTRINKNPADFSAVVDIVMPLFLRCIKHRDLVDMIADQLLVSVSRKILIKFKYIYLDPLSAGGTLKNAECQISSLSYLLHCMLLIQKE